jgi:hypothetical protein
LNHSTIPTSVLPTPPPPPIVSVAMTIIKVTSVDRQTFKINDDHIVRHR